MQKALRIGFAMSLLAASAFAAVIPAGQQVRVRLGQTISSDKARTGESWSGTLASDVVVNGETIHKRGASVRGRVVEADDSGRLKGRALLKLQLTSIGGQPVRSRIIQRIGPAHAKRNAVAIGGGAALGAAIGAIAGGGKGAAIGAASGAGAGTVGAAATGKKDIVLPVESLLTFTLR